MERLTSPATIKKILGDHGIVLSKRWGQNFFADGNILDKIIGSVNITENTQILEIGAGMGTLTYEAAKRAKRVTTVEIDTRLIPVLSYTLREFNNVAVINEDFLKVDATNLWADNLERVVLGNLPYYITTPIILRLLGEEFDAVRMMFTLQDEAVDKLVALPGSDKYCALSMLVQQKYTPIRIASIPNTAFLPRPEVSSAAVLLTKRSDAYVMDKGWATFVHALFSQRRKKLLNVLSSLPVCNGISKADISCILSEFNIDGEKRCEVFSADEIASLYLRLTKK